MSNTTIQLRKSGQTGNTPADLAHGELAINYADGKLFYKNGVGIKAIENQKTFSTINANNSLIIATSPTDILSLVAGSNILLGTNTTTKTITISVPGGSSIDTLARELAQAAYDEANTQNVINQTQNTWITNTNTFAQAAYNFANTRFSSSGGTISGNVTIQNDLSVLGNVNFVGNVTSITVTGNSGQFFGYASNGHNALYAGIPVGYDFQPFTIFQASANYDGYSQINIQNINNGTNASSDLVATADNGTEDNTYIDMGIGSSQHADPEYTLVGPNDGYLYVSGNTTTGGGDLVIGTFLPQNDVVIAAGGMNSENEQMRFVGSSNTIIIRSNVDSSLSKSVLLGTVANVRITGGSSGQILRTDGAGNLSFINSPVDLATAAYGAANTAAGNTVALQAQMSTTNTNVAAVNTFTQAAFNSANAGVTLATAAFDTANTAAGNTVYLQTINNLQNTNITSTDTLATAAYAQANNASGNTVALQAVNTVQNTNITAVNTFAQAAYNQANTAPTQLQTAGIRTNASYFPLFVDSNNAVLTAESIYSTGAGITINPSTNTITATTFSGGLNGSVVGASGSFSSFVDLTGDDDYIEWGASNDARMMYSGTANTINLQLYSDVISFKVVDNANTADRFIFYKANGDLRLVSGNVIFSDGTVQRTEALTAAQAAFNSANAGVTLATAAYAQANNASGNTVALQAQMSTTNTNITSVNTFAQAGFNSANAGVTLATAAYAQANSASGNTVALQAQMSTTNTNITSVNTFAQAAFNSANAGVTLATAAFGVANTAAGNTVALQAQMTTTNTNVAAVNTFAQAGFNSANAGVTLATAAYAQANNASGNTVALQAQMSTTNTNITSVNTFTQAAFNSANAGVTLAQSAYNTANLKFDTTGGTITGNVTIQNNLVVQGNLSVLGNSTTISTSTLAISDPLIFLANGNIVTDVVDIGIIGHYGGPSGETHTGIFRDPNLKEWIVFQGYTDQIQSNNLINIAAPSFAYANLYANVVKSNLISTYSVVNGLDVFSTMSSAFASANAGVTLATAAFSVANNASGNTVALQAVNSLQNTNITSVNTFTQAAFNSANAGVTLATAAFSVANNASGNTVALQAQMSTTNTNVTAVNTFTQAAFNSANAGVTLATAAFGTANNASGNTVALQAVNSLQNTNITAVNTFTQAAFNKANNALANTTGIFDGTLSATGIFRSLQSSGDEGGQIDLSAAQTNTSLNTGVSIDVFQNRIRIFETGGSNRGVYIDLANGAATGVSTNLISSGTGGSDTVAFAAYAQANNASGNTVALQAQMSTTNTNITSVNTFAGSAFASANAGVTLATAAYAQANSASGNTVALQAQMSTTNTNITAVNTFAQAAYNTANNAGGTPSTINTRGIQTNASYFPIFVDSNNATATAESLFSHGDLIWNPSLDSLSAASLRIGPWTGGANYRAVSHANMTGSEYMVISGDTDPNTYLSAFTGGSVVIRGGNNSSTAQVTVSTTTTSVTGGLSATGTITSNSDERYKANWRSVTPNFVQKLSLVRSGIYDRTDIKATQAGVSAQSLQEIIPEAVSESEEGKLTVAYGNAALVACVELAKEIVNLKNEIAELKSKLEK